MPAAAMIASSRARHTCCQEGRRSQAVPASQLSKIRSRAAQAALSVSIDHLLMRVPGVLVGLCAQFLGAGGGGTPSVAPNCCLIENIFSIENGYEKRLAPLRQPCHVVPRGASVCQPVLRKPAATPLIDNWMPRCTRSSILFSLDKARLRLINSTCKWFSGSR